MQNLRRSAAALVTLALVPACSSSEEPAPPESEAVQRFEACERTFEIIEPVEGYAWTPNAITLVSEQVADGVFAIYDENAPVYGPMGLPLATSGGFVVGDDGVLMVESMINRQLFCQAVALMRAETDKPLRYVINTSHHGDHSYGNHFLPDDVQVVQHTETAAFIQNPESFTADVAFMEANFGADQGLDEIQPRVADVEVGSEGWSIDLGGKTVTAVYLGFGQTDGDLFVHVEEGDVLFTGNPIVAREPAIPWLLDGHAEEVRATLAAVGTEFATATVVPGHDAPHPATVTDFAVDYLTALLDETQTAVDDGLTLDETVAQVTLEDYQGYVLWDWVHSVVNVPATYGELTSE